ncbi:ComF family protein [Halobacillus salinarum]|uniref:ComF family protein n=1 Tax=Halobacillus salinarum TaxID=2932257 RepID=A0ABY4EQ01_9BACI|nr:ComF family protein [Halobacillus salinarum]UOQ45722.1 ComF family protein [Halobacillus salinarum]
MLHSATWTDFWRIEYEEILCPACVEKLTPLTKPGCLRCSRTDANGICLDCERWEADRKWEGVLEKNFSAFQYTDGAKDIVARWKYRGDYRLIDVFQKQLKKTYKPLKRLPLVPIPLSPERLRERGFNQAEAMIHALGVSPTSLFSRISSEKQAKKNRKERMSSENPFHLHEHITEPVVLVDDIYTTGTTVRHAAKLLKDSGCPKVYALTLFR